MSSRCGFDAAGKADLIRDEHDLNMPSLAENALWTPFGQKFRSAIPLRRIASTKSSHIRNPIPRYLFSLCARYVDPGTPVARALPSQTKVSTPMPNSAKKTKGTPQHNKGSLAERYEEI